MKQTSFASAEYAGKKRKSRRERFLAETDKVVQWSRLEALIEPHYPKIGKVGRLPRANAAERAGELSTDLANFCCHWRPHSADSGKASIGSV